jgi:hypothetical protein
LLLVGLAVLVLLLSARGSVTLNLLGYKTAIQQSVAFFGFLASGVLAGFLLR